MEDAKLKLTQAGLSQTNVEEYEKLIQLCDFGQFGGSKRDDKAWNAALDTAETLLRKLDREL
jgi:triacylglycerol esterase/lipase EstA (alpha/beta hydrolase family)